MHISRRKIQNYGNYINIYIKKIVKNIRVKADVYKNKQKNVLEKHNL